MIGREKQRGRMDRDLVALTSDGFGAESWAHDKHFSTPAVQCLCLNPTFSLIKIMCFFVFFYLRWFQKNTFFFFAYLNQAIFCGYNVVDFSCSVQFHTTLFIPEGQFSFTVYQSHLHVTGDGVASGHESSDTQVAKLGPHAESESKLQQLYTTAGM